jgi:O-antigen ligase
MFAAIRRAAIVIVLCLVVAVFAFPAEIGTRWAFYMETLSPSSTANELPNRVWDYPVKNLLDAFSEPNWVEGNGIGTASLGVQYVSTYLHQGRLPIAVESGWGNILVEFGFIGLILWLVWTSLAVLACWRITLRLKQTRMFPIGFAICWFVFVMLIPEMYSTLNAFQDYVLNAYLWILIGVLYQLPEILIARPVPVPSAAIAASPPPGGAGLMPAELPTS